jgi:hypothetical protein
MKTVFLTFVFSALLVMSAWAAPFLICNPQTNVTSYMLTFDGVEQEVGAYDLGDDTVTLHFDLCDIADGDHTGEVRAKNIWGVSEALPFYFSKAVPECPSVVNISPE